MKEKLSWDMKGLKGFGHMLIVRITANIHAQTWHMCIRLDTIIQCDFFLNLKVEYNREMGNVPVFYFIKVEIL